MDIRQNQPLSPEVVARLREANENLVVASVRAQELQDQAEAAIERQKEFLAMLAHELRNPLAPIASAAGILRHVASKHPQVPHLEHIYQVIDRSVSHMSRLLEDLLDTSRVTSGKITLRKSALPLADLVQNAVELSQPLLDKNRQLLTVNLPEAPVIIEGDAERLAQVISNLLTNASKYSAPEKPIVLSAGYCDGDMIAICVKDEGVGIDPDIQPYIFDLFTQAPTTLARSLGGLGIGLSLVRSLVQLHGGSVSVYSDGLGHGSEFTVLLPLADAETAKAACAPPSAVVPPCRILLIEDNVDANETLSLCLTAEGHTVASAFDGPAGLALAKSGDFDIVLCDIGLPGMSGYEVLRQMRLLALDPEPGYIAMTGYSQDESSETVGLATGFDRYMVKPVPIAALRAAISSLLQPAGTT